MNKNMNWVAIAALAAVVALGLMVVHHDMQQQNHIAQQQLNWERIDPSER